MDALQLNVLEKHVSQDTRDKIENELTFLRDEKVTWLLLQKLYEHNMLTFSAKQQQQAAAISKNQADSSSSFVFVGSSLPQIYNQQQQPSSSPSNSNSNSFEGDANGDASFELRKQQVIVKWLQEITTTISVEQKNKELVVQKVLQKHSSVTPDHKRANIHPENVKNIADDASDENFQLRENELLQLLWHWMRAGKVEEAQLLCRQCNQYWRAATLAGVNNDVFILPSSLAEQQSGNQNRFMYLATLLDLSEDDKLQSFERGVYGSLCGHLGSMLYLSNSWEDYLWSYLKANIVMKINKQLKVDSRSHDKKFFSAVLDKQTKLLQQYNIHEATTNLAQICEYLKNSENVKISAQAKQEFRLIQVAMMLDNIAVASIDEKSSSIAQALTSLCKLNHGKRFASHLLITILAMTMTMMTNNNKQQELVTAANSSSTIRDEIISQYISYLITKVTPSSSSAIPSSLLILKSHASLSKKSNSSSSTSLIDTLNTYLRIITQMSSYLSEKHQIEKLSNFYMNIEQEEERKLCIQYSELHKLHLHKILLHVVDKIRAVSNNNKNNNNNKFFLTCFKKYEKKTKKI